MTTFDANPKSNLRRRADFVGREDELQKVLDALNPSTRSWIISLTGVGGIGKTELAVECAHIAMAQGLFDSVVWTTAKESWLSPEEGIQPYSETYSLVSLVDLLNTIIDVLKMDDRLRIVSPERKIRHVKEKLASAAYLLIVDNLETVQDRAVIQFLTEVPVPSKALVTSRVGGLGSIDIVAARTLEGQREIPIGPLSKGATVSLFTKRAATNGLLVTKAEDLAKVEVLAELSGGSPLAIEWIVGQMALKGYGLDDAIRLLSSSNHQVLKYCFENLVSLAGRKAKKVLVAVPIFAQSAKPEALAVITGMKRTDLDEALRRLTQASLVEIDSDGTYKVLAPTRLYVKSLWRRLPDLYRDYSIRTAEYYVQILDRESRRHRWDAAKNEYHNMIHILSWCFENNYLDLVLDLAQAMSEFLHRNGLWDQRVRVCEMATIAAANVGKKDKAVSFTYDSAEIHKARGRYEQAYDEFQKCEDYSNEVGDSRGAAFARMQKGVILYHKGRHGEAVRMLQNSFEMHRINDDKHGMAINLSLLGRNELQTGNIEASRKYFEDSLALKRSINDQLGEAIGLYDLGHYYYLTRDFQRSEIHFRSSLSILEGLQEKRHASNAKWYYALLQIERGYFEDARRLLIEVILVEETLQRDIYLERASAKLAEIDRAIAFKSHVKGANFPLPEMQTSAVRNILIVAIENYKNLPSIPHANKDVQDLTSMLTKAVRFSKYETTTLINKNATCAAIRQSLKALPKRDVEEQDLLIVFITHTVRLENRNYLCAYDTDVQDLDNSAIEGLEFVSVLREVSSPRTILVVDTQHDMETFIEDHNRNSSQSLQLGFASKYYDYLATSTSANILLSCAEGQRSHKFTHMESRLFMHFLLKGIAGDASLRGDNIVYLQDLFYYLEKRSQESTKDQSPQSYPQPVESDLIFCAAPYFDQALEKLAATNVVASKGGKVTQEIVEIKKKPPEINDIRELIIRDPIQGAAELSRQLSNIQLRSQVDLYRSELNRIQSDKVKYGQIDPNLASQWQRCVFNLLEICLQRFDMKT